MGFQLGCYGDTVATTPHMDRLAREGTRFTRGHITQVSCSPSRSSMLTGLYPHQNGQIGLAHLGYSMRPENDPHEFRNLAGQPVVQAEQARLFKALQSWRAQTQDPLLDLSALRALVLKEKDAPPTPVPAWKKAKLATTTEKP